MRDILIIGAGASGLMAAVTAARLGARVTVLDGEKKPGRKLLMTGNGRCNLTNLEADLWTRYHSSDPEALAHCCKALCSALDVPGTLRFFEGIGVAVSVKKDLVYPHSGQARSVLDALLAEAARLGVRLRLDGKAEGLRREKETGRWAVLCGGWEYKADRVILCAGSCAAAQTGSDGSGYTLAEKLGHRIQKPLPALTGLICSEERLSCTAGARSDAEAFLYVDGRKVRTEEGQVQWAKDGISGVVIFQLSTLAGAALSEGRKVSLGLDLAADLSREVLKDFLEERIGAEANLLRKVPEREALQRILGGIVPDRLTGLLLEKAGFSAAAAEKGEDKRSGAGGRKAGLSVRETAVRLADTLKHLPLEVSGVRGFDQAQVCSGGVSLSQINPETFESRLAGGLYFAGEILDADGPCGGYNLQWAWSGGYLAGRSAAL